MSDEENPENQEKEPSEENEENKSQSNQDEPEEQVKEEVVEKEDEKEEKDEAEEPQETREEPPEEPPETREEPQETREEPEREEPTREEPVEKRIERVESDREEHDEEENQEEPEIEIPTEIILFSTLSKEEKIKYFNFFIANDTIFNREPEGTWIAEIDIFEDEKPEQNDLMLSSRDNNLKNLRQSKFRTTKKDYDAIYSKLIKVINPAPGIKGTKMNLNAIKYMIQEIYSLKFLKDTQALFNKEDVEPESFPIFVGNFLINKFPKKDTLHKKAIDFMLSLDFYGLKHKDIKVFQQFVTEEYDADDLIFYLFVRSCIEKEQKVFFLEKAKENLGQGLLYGQEDDDILIPVKKCEKLARAIFGNDEDELMSNFMDNIKKLLETDAADEKKKHLKANAILNMSLANYHNSRGKVDEADEEKERDNSDEEKEKEKKKKSKKKREKSKEKEDKKKQKKKEETKKKGESKKKNKSKHKVDSDEDEEEEKEDRDEEEEVEEKVVTKPPTKLRAQKKTNLKSATATNKAPASAKKTKPSTTSTATKSSKTSKVSNPIKSSTGKSTATKSSNPNKINPPKTTTNRINTTSNTGGTKTSSNSARQGRKASQEARENKNKLNPPPNRKAPGASSVGKRKVNTSVGKKPVERKAERVIEQTPEFKKLLNKNRIDKIANESEKLNCLLYIISDYFKLKEIDGYFKNIVDNNPIFKNYSAKIFANIKNTKEFTLKKLNGICKYIASGDKTGFNNFMKVKDKGKTNFDNMKSAFNSLLKSGPLKNLNENDIKDFCKMILAIPELSIQTSKSLLKYCE